MFLCDQQVLWMCVLRRNTGEGGKLFPGDEAGEWEWMGEERGSRKRFLISRGKWHLRGMVGIAWRVCVHGALGEEVVVESIGVLKFWGYCLLDPTFESLVYLF